MARAWDKKVQLEVPTKMALKVGERQRYETIEPTIKEGIQCLCEFATSGSERLVYKAVLAIMDEIEQIDAKSRVRIKMSPRIADLLRGDEQP